MTDWMPSGRVAWRRFLPALLAGLAAALMLAHWAWWADARGLGVPALSAWAFALLAGYVGGMVVRIGHCRHPLLGGLVGVLLAWIAFFGMFEFALLDLGGDPRQLSNYVVLRMRQARGPRDEARDAVPVAAPLDAPRGAMSAREAWRWTAFVAEWLGATALGGWLARNAAKLPFSESRRQWLHGTARGGPRGFGRAALAALEGRTEPHGALPGAAVVVMEFLPPLADSPDLCVSIRDWANDTDPAPRWLVLRQRLDDAERARFVAWHARTR